MHQSKWLCPYCGTHNGVGTQLGTKLEFKSEEGDTKVNWATGRSNANKQETPYWKK